MNEDVYRAYLIAYIIGRSDGQVEVRDIAPEQPISGLIAGAIGLNDGKRAISFDKNNVGHPAESGQVLSLVSALKYALSVKSTATE